MKGSHLYCLLFTILGVVQYGVVASGSKSSVEDQQDVLCPVPEDIFPCVCGVNDNNTLDIDCSKVVYEDELANVFRSYFPNPNFRRFTIKFNYYLQTLRDGALGNTTYTEFFFTESVLEVVEKNALSGSFHTATYLNFYSTKLQSFPFDDISSFTKLVTLDLRFNYFHEFPNISSVTLKTLALGGNSFDHLPTEAFVNTPSVSSINVYLGKLWNISSGTFSGLPYLESVDLSFNFLKHIPEAAVEVTTPTYINLNYNMISSVEVDAFLGVTGGSIDLHSNQLKEIQEAVWRPLLQYKVQLDLSKNPLECGCELAWLVLSDTFLHQVNENTTCADGRLVVDLDPADYEPC
ncbi:oplophorus-luciferin 2-monooxygenase non-catalytic subunit-like [Homarus americanus]|uniref:Oplophorus-luciferin 2-monooxygenase non-catalytic subunit-like 6 n=1 Tax=Homarus americanus TaxID=6706 RepID=A0A8J5JFU0_HOMAM|nr:oplophorus-luciferin 2-monooxygenase non-catalytic subunit-like [Homarus americanus]XP_042204733.1 oplophorus-luciferin 2-monooxygenase non-catalytic subunit-like [Homarus americanus]KAG7155894.1 Oplophorus-luciferin 2-monooxygenase non-catalytic subunit-like 6 [Homarus americanus]